MATSSKVQFNLEALRAKAMESINFRIDAKTQELLSYDDETVLIERINEWRGRQIDRMRSLIAGFETGEIGDSQLAKFELEAIPSVDKYERRKLQRELTELEADRSRIEAKSGSLVADDKGNISLTTTQLQEFFGL